MIVYLAEYNSNEAQFLLNNPVLKAAHAGTNDSQIVPKFDTYFLMGISDDKQTIYAGLEIKPISDRVVDVHVHVMPEFWGTNVSDEFVENCIEWVKTNTEIKYAITETPSCCEQVLNFLDKVGFKRIHIFKNGVTYHGEAADLLIYRYDVKRK